MKAQTVPPVPPSTPGATVSSTTAITALSRAHGLLRIGERREGLEAGSEVEVELLVPAVQVERTTLCVGSHDPALDVLGDLLSARSPGARLATRLTTRYVFSG